MASDSGCQLDKNVATLSLRSEPHPRPYSFAVRPKRGYGIRDVDGEYSDLADMVALFTTSPIHSHVIKLLESAERRRLAKAEAAAIAVADAYLEAERQERCKHTESERISATQHQQQLSAIKLREEERIAKVFQEVEDLRRRQQIESDLLDKELLSSIRKSSLNFDYKRLDDSDVSTTYEHQTTLDAGETERKELDLKKRLESEELERRSLEHKRRVEAAEASKQKELEEQKRIAAAAQEKEKAALQEADKRAALLKLESKKAQEEPPRRLPPKIGASSSEHLVPAEFQGCILYDDLQKYAKSQELLERLQHETKHINNASKFYNGAIKVVNAPLNQISAQTHVKINHFTSLLEGRNVQAPGLASQFSITHEKSGDLFVKNLLAFRFVKKAEADSSENKLKRENLNYLAIVGVALSKKFPDVEDLIQAHFYKACPFLVPFNYPRNGMDIRTYAAAIGHNINIGGDSDNQALEASITQTLLDKLGGYCMLYGYMVRNSSFHTGAGASKPKKENSFFSVKEVWRILATMLSLDPQDEVTATILQSLLEILDKNLKSTFGRQYKKLLQYMRDVYVEKIRSITSKGKSGSLARLELLLEKCAC